MCVFTGVLLFGLCASVGNNIFSCTLLIDNKRKLYFFQFTSRDCLFLIIHNTSGGTNLALGKPVFAVEWQVSNF